MSLHQRVSANGGRRASVSHSAAYATSDYEQRLLDSLNTAHTELNKTNSERDRYLGLLEQANKKLAEVTVTNTDLKSQNQNLKDTIASLQERIQRGKEESDRLGFENDALAQDYAELKAKYSNLSHQFNALNSAPPPFSNNATNGLPGSMAERPKLSRSSSKKERKEDREERSREERSRVRDKEKSRDREREDKREREKEKERDKENVKEKEKKEHRAEKERLSRRFEERRVVPPAPAPAAPAPPPPPITNRRNSFIEGWGPAGRTSSASGSSTRSYTNGPHGPNGHIGHNGHAQVPAVTPVNKAPYANISRTATNPMTPRIYSAAGSTAAVFDDDGGYEDGNYHAYPISR
ncbi:uncharacterized protein TrAtP1_005663 [Trichoderma atroviride]|uniref:uncharacterized protein n=1 Tax=Hypocrea atroviridis TaxID=63577 RepID=UPI003323ECE0|nr:hypothetical protein TrAtP1_005663 [Trichoderma atroviride]